MIAGKWWLWVPTGFDERMAVLSLYLFSGQQIPEVDRRCGSVVGMCGVDGALVGGSGAVGSAELGQQNP